MKGTGASLWFRSPNANSGLSKTTASKEIP